MRNNLRMIRLGLAVAMASEICKRRMTMTQSKSNFRLGLVFLILGAAMARR